MAAPLRCLYVDLDNTLLGRGGSLVHDGDGAVSLLPMRAIEACHRAEVEVVIMSGRRPEGVRQVTRVLGGRAYVFESGAAVVDDGETEWLTAPYLPGPDGEPSVHELIARTGAPDELLARFSGDLEHHAPWHLDREVSHLFRGRVDALEATSLVADRDLRLIDNGIVFPGDTGLRAYHLVPAGVSKGRAVARHMRSRGYAPEECIAAGDSREDLTTAEGVGTVWLVANALERDPSLREAMTANTRVAEAANGPGVYEAVVTELAERR